MHHSLIWAFVALPCLVSAQSVSTSARCGPNYGLTCLGSVFGNCCSQYSYCGSTAAYCGTGCQVGWGTCTPTSSRASTTLSTLAHSSSTRSASSASSSPTLRVSTSSRCGKGFGLTCQGSKYGDCCSQYSYCGKTTAYCGDGCQMGFGKCNSVSLSASRSASSTASSLASSSPSSSSVRSSSILQVSSSSAARASTSSVVSSSIASVLSASSSIASTPSADSSSTLVPSSTVASSSTASSPTAASSSIAASSSTVVSVSTPSTSTAAPSSASSADISPASSSASSSSIVPSSTGPSITPISCPTTQLVNSGFESDTIAPWDLASYSIFFTPKIETDGSHDSSNYYSFEVTNPRVEGDMVANMVQTLTFSSTAQIQFSAWVRISLPSSREVPVSFAWLVDNVAFGSGLWTTFATGSPWVRITSDLGVIAPGAHTIKVRTKVASNAELGTKVSIDDILINYASCISASSSSSGVLSTRSTAAVSSSAVSSSTSPSTSSSSVTLTTSSSSFIPSLVSSTASITPSPTPTSCAPQFQNSGFGTGNLEPWTIDGGSLFPTYLSATVKANDGFYNDNYLAITKNQDTAPASELAWYFGQSVTFPATAWVRINAKVRVSSPTYTLVRFMWLIDGGYEGVNIFETSSRWFTPSVAKSVSAGTHSFGMRITLPIDAPVDTQVHLDEFQIFYEDGEPSCPSATLSSSSSVANALSSTSSVGTSSSSAIAILPSSTPSIGTSSSSTLQTTSTPIVLSSSTSSTTSNTPSPTPASCANRFQNGDFETGDVTPWVIAGGSSLFPTYLSSAVRTNDGYQSNNYLAITKIQNSAPVAAQSWYFRQPLSFPTGMIVSVSVWIRVISPDPTAFAKFMWMRDLNFPGQTTTVNSGTGWFNLRYESLSISVGTHSIGLYNYIPVEAPSGTEIHLDGFEIIYKDGVAMCGSALSSSSSPAQSSSSTLIASSASTTSSTSSPLPLSTLSTEANVVSSTPSANASPSSTPQTSSTSSMLSSSEISSTLIPSTFSTSVVSQSTPTPTVSSAANFFVNPDFETGQITPWTGSSPNVFETTIKTMDGHESSSYVSTKCTRSSSCTIYTLKQPSIQVPSTGTYQVSVWMRVSSNTGETINVGWTYDGTTKMYLANLKGGDGWVKVILSSAIMVTSTQTHTVGVIVQPSLGLLGTTIDFDDFSMTAVTAP